MAEIPIDKLVAAYFNGRKEHIDALPSYSELEGKESAYRFLQISANSDAPDNNPFVHVPEEVQANWQRVFSHLYNTPADSVKLKEVTIMISGRTYPLRATADVGGVEKVCYAKKPDASRFIGLELFNIMSGYRPLDFVFDKSVFVADSAPGKLEARWDREELYSFRPFLENLVRLDTVAQYCCLNDLYHPHNKTVDSDGNIYVIDFDKALNYRNEDLLSSVELPDDEIAAIAKDERQLLARRVLKEQKRVQVLVDILKKHDYGQGEAEQYQIDAENMGEVIAYMLEKEGIKIK